MFAKAYVLSATDFRSWVIDLQDMFVEEYPVDEYSEEQASEEFENYLVSSFELLLDEGDVDEMVVFLTDALFLSSGQDLVRLIDREYGIKKLVRGMGYRERIGERRQKVFRNRLLEGRRLKRLIRR